MTISRRVTFLYHRVSAVDESIAHADVNILEQKLEQRPSASSLQIAVRNDFGHGEMSSASQIPPSSSSSSSSSSSRLRVYSARGTRGADQEFRRINLALVTENSHGRHEYDCMTGAKQLNLSLRSMDYVDSHMCTFSVFTSWFKHKLRTYTLRISRIP